MAVHCMNKLLKAVSGTRKHAHQARQTLLEICCRPITVGRVSIGKRALISPAERVKAF